MDSRNRPGRNQVIDLYLKYSNQSHSNVHIGNQGAIGWAPHKLYESSRLFYSSCGPHLQFGKHLCHSIGLFVQWLCISTLKYPPMFVGPLLIYHTMEHTSYHGFFSQLLGQLPECRVKAIGSDGETALCKAIKTTLPGAVHWRCIMLTNRFIIITIFTDSNANAVQSSIANSTRNTSYSTLCSYCTRPIHIHPCIHIDKKPIVFFEDAHAQYQDMCMMLPWLPTACTTIWHLHYSPWDLTNMEPSNWMYSDSGNQCTLPCWYWLHQT